MRIIVVGGAGYIGSHVTKSLLEAGHQPVVVDNLQSGKAENLLPGVPFVHADLRIPETLKGVLNGCEGLVHLAALKAAGDSMTQPEKYANHNISGTIQLLNAATESGVRFVIFSSTAAVYGDPQYIPMDEEHPTKPSNFYGYTKLVIEELLSWYAQLKGVRFASLRYFNAAGYDLDGKIKGLESEPNNLLPIVMEAVIGKRSFVEVFGTDYETQDGSCIRDYIHVDDLADGHVRALEYLTRETDNPILNLGTSNGMSVLEILEHTKNLSHTNFDVRFGPRRPGDPAIVLAKATRAKTLLGWEAKRSDPNTLINSMLNAYRATR
ncbi:MAG: UDP-glucose 4-epimerase GalE [Deltaproteobacteria bacterium]|nr:UDP-glucose 4-epimerase GalE [Deltaproteobacteria bacterium]MBT7204093.1 UDP-glucose 4-epimerase GalE [Deltaproteobacteria bacterium]